jgi:predicted small secreted protein
LFYRFKKAKKMKKLVLMFVAIAAISFASCGNKTAQAPAQDTDSVADTTVADSAAADSTLLLLLTEKERKYRWTQRFFRLYSSQIMKTQ